MTSQLHEIFFDPIVWRIINLCHCMFPFSDRCGDNDGMTIALRTALNCHPQKMEFPLFESSKSQIIKMKIYFLLLLTAWFLIHDAR